MVWPSPEEDVLVLVKQTVCVFFLEVSSLIIVFSPFWRLGLGGCRTRRPLKPFETVAVIKVYTNTTDNRLNLTRHLCESKCEQLPGRLRFIMLLIYDASYTMGSSFVFVDMPGRERERGERYRDIAWI